MRFTEDDFFFEESSSVDDVGFLSFARPEQRFPPVRSQLGRPTDGRLRPTAPIDQKSPRPTDARPTKEKVLAYEGVH
jgi:hypothetical protein